ncbi:MAG: 23S rRNA (pseudouridine(1915)-N(3))-methyltransferase RlmH [Dethiobacteria bacterium]
MNIRIIAAGRIKEPFLQQGIQGYKKRLSPYARLEIKDIREQPLPEAAGEKEIASALAKEKEQVEKLLRRSSFKIVLAIEGELYSSEELAQKIKSMAVSGQSEFDIIIGGPVGLHSSLKQKADLLLSFSRLTFPHQLMRLLLLEQLYRSFKIIRGEF